MRGVIDLIDPCPDDAALLLDALVAQVDGDEVLDGWQLTDKRLLVELERAQLRATRERARWLSLLAEVARSCQARGRRVQG